jgi:hypothetical protein
MNFVLPSEGFGSDWVLVFDDAAASFKAPATENDSATQSYSFAVLVPSISPALHISQSTFCKSRERSSAADFRAGLSAP